MTNDGLRFRGRAPLAAFTLEYKFTEAPTHQGYVRPGNWRHHRVAFAARSREFLPERTR
ncbi:hypothetical protein AGR4C_Lc10052 [Agrobacterium tumefaciens str. Kerr 14]|uniref:Uncharacterized protein n=1 Tax=Agrobacterium tumefaciens str. Kerr 14 TaxID=1183424 RepID=A0A1S7QXR7_AGRTU|nr:hypothetical protein AGR4C_Lc10052 [Agrobacterium tumefaciens str. Kerr 14]